MTPAICAQLWAKVPVLYLRKHEARTILTRTPAVHPLEGRIKLREEGLQTKREMRSGDFPLLEKPRSASSSVQNAAPRG